MIFDGLGFRKEVWFSDKKIMNLFLIKITADGRKGQRGPLTPHPAPRPSPLSLLFRLLFQKFVENAVISGSVCQNILF